MGFRYRRRIAFGPFRLNLSKSGASWSVKAGPVTINPRRNSAYVNLPGGSYYQAPLRRRASERDLEIERQRQRQRRAEQYRRAPAAGTLAHAAWQWRQAATGPAPIVNKDGVVWYKAPLPRRFHTCHPWTTGTDINLGRVERCACGAVRIGGFGHPWMDRNSRRKQS